MSSRTEERLTSTFEAIDARGNRHEIEVWRYFAMSQTLDGSPAETPGLKDYRTTAGVQLNYLEKGKYQVAATGEVLTSDDPEAD